MQALGWGFPAERFAWAATEFGRDGVKIPAPGGCRGPAGGRPPADQHVLGDVEYAGAIGPRRAGGPTKMDTVPGRSVSGATAVGGLRGRGVGLAPGVGLGEAEPLCRALGGCMPCGGEIHGIGTGSRITRSVRIRPSTSTGSPSSRYAMRGGVEADVEDDQNVSITRLPAAHVEHAHEHPVR